MNHITPTLTTVRGRASRWLLALLLVALPLLNLPPALALAADADTGSGIDASLFAGLNMQAPKQRLPAPPFTWPCNTKS